MEAVVNDGLQQLLVVVRALANLGQVGQNIWQQVLVALWQAPKLTLGTFDLLLDMDPDKKRRKSKQGCATKEVRHSKEFFCMTWLNKRFSLSGCMHVPIERSIWCII